MYELVTLAKAGVQEMNLRRYWLCIPCGQIPAFARKTDFSGFVVPDQ